MPSFPVAIATKPLTQYRRDLDKTLGHVDAFEVQQPENDGEACVGALEETIACAGLRKVVSLISPFCF